MENRKELSTAERANMTAVMYNLIFMNDTAISCLFKAMTALQESAYWQKGVKRWGSVVRQEMNRYSMRFSDKVGREMITFIADLNDKFEEQLQIDLMKLRNACLLNIGRKKDAELAADVYIAMTFLFGACNNNDHCLDHLPHLKCLLPKFRWMRLSNMTKAFLKLTMEFDRMLGYTYQPQLDDDMNVRNGFKVIANRLSDADNIIDTCNSCATQWEAENPDFEIKKA